MRISAAAIVPARMASSRLPGKPLVDIEGKPMIQYVYERAARARLIDRVIVATPDEEILRAVEEFGGTAVMTSPKHRSGTDRLAEAAIGIGEEIVVNVQGDEPLVEPADIDSLVEVFSKSTPVEMASLMHPITQKESSDPNLVKVVVDRRGYALYFSRATIPYARDESQQPPFHGHIGLYAYTRETLLRLAKLAPTPLEIAESLEQLRALENGIRIMMVETHFGPIGVDTIEDLERVRRIIGRG